MYTGNGNNSKMLKLYAKRKAEDRKIFLINKLKCDSIVDLGCGNGEYLPYLQRRAKFVVGLDINKKLAKISHARGFDIILATIDHSPFKDKSFDGVWAAEVIEHFSNLEVLNKIERIASEKLVLTMPNPIFPHFEKDPTHILHYSVTSLRHFLNNKSKSSTWTYSVRGLGFDYMIPTKLIKRLTLYATWLVPWLSPTICVVGVNENKGESIDQKS
jgi:SAM-dependent methyltransferase